MSGSQRGSRFTIAARTTVTLPGWGPRRFAAGLGLLVALAALMATLGAATASAYECYSGYPNCKGQGELQHLVQGAPGTPDSVMPTTTTYFVYWAPNGAPAFPAKYESGIKTFFKGIEHDNGTDQNFYSVLTQYGVKYETHVGKAINDKNPYPAESPDCSSSEGAPPSKPCVSVRQITAELTGLVKENKLAGQAFEAGQAKHVYFVLLPPGVSVCDGSYSGHSSVGCSSRQFCAYHSFHFGGTETAEDVPFAMMPYLPGTKGCEDPQQPNGVNESEFAVLEHEFAEMITDPFGIGWANSPSVGAEEVVDICQSGLWAGGNPAFGEKMRYGTALGTAPNGALYNQVIDGQDYYLQQPYSNATETCVQRIGLPPTVTKLSPARGSIAGGKKVKITGLNFENPTVTGVSFGKVPAKEFTVTSPTSITAVTPAAASAGAVEVKLTTSAGTNASTTADQYTYE